LACRNLPRPFCYQSRASICGLMCARPSLDWLMKGPQVNQERGRRWYLGCHILRGNKGSKILISRTECGELTDWLDNKLDIATRSKFNGVGAGTVTNHNVKSSSSSLSIGRAPNPVMLLLPFFVNPTAGCHISHGC
jgi:hypothetical protein